MSWVGISTVRVSPMMLELQNWMHHMSKRSSRWVYRFLQLERSLDFIRRAEKGQKRLVIFYFFGAVFPFCFFTSLSLDWWNWAYHILKCLFDECSIFVTGQNPNLNLQAINGPKSSQLSEFRYYSCLAVLPHYSSG